MLNHIKIFLLTGLMIITWPTLSQSITIERKGNGWQLNVNNQNYSIKGIVGHTYLEKAKAYGANSVRIGYEKEELVKVERLGLKALVNLPADAERYGFDYSNQQAVDKQTNEIIEIVKKIKDHPAVLMWAIGNELDYIPPLKPFNPKVWDAINQAAKAIKEIDPNHPVMTVIGTSMMEKVADIVKQCPDIDLLGINTYGDIYTLPETLKKYGWGKPYLISEWGPDGYWEVKRTSWGAPYEQTDREKYNCYRDKYLKAINNENCLGSYVFYWYHKQETTHTWFSMFNKNGLETPLPGLMKELWTGFPPENLSPVVDSLNIDEFFRYQDIILKSGSKHKAKVSVYDKEGDSPEIKWEIRPEAVYASYAGQGEKEPKPIPDLVMNTGKETVFKAPAKEGAYRLFVYAYDNNSHYSSSNLPFLVKK
ncbi:MAG: glycoside hydrolase family 2 TIM barrel-domain containing protein [Bacteroidales bacterium]